MDRVVGFSFDGASFTDKMNPFDQARAPTAVTTRKPGQRFNLGFTEKGRHEDTEGNVPYFMVAITCGKGVTAAEQYHDRINVETFSLFVCEYFASMF